MERRSWGQGPRMRKGGEQTQHQLHQALGDEPMRIFGHTLTFSPLLTSSLRLSHVRHRKHYGKKLTAFNPGRKDKEDQRQRFQ